MRQERGEEKQVCNSEQTGLEGSQSYSRRHFLKKVIPVHDFVLEVRALPAVCSESWSADMRGLNGASMDLS